MALNKETSVNASVVIEKELYKKLKQIAKDENRSISAQINYIIKKYIKEWESKNV